MENIQLSNILHIQEASKQGKLVMFVGAGVSANSGVGKSSVSCPLKPSDSTPLKHSTMPP